jgi:hypothetical protein
MNISSVGPPVIALAGPQGPSAAAAQIASNIATDGSDSGIAEELQIAVLQKALAASKTEAIDLHV